MIAAKEVTITDGTAVGVSSAAEAVSASYTIPAGAAQLGKVFKFSYMTKTTASNGTDELVVRVRLGPTTLTGTALFTSASVDQANGDVSCGHGEIVFRDIDGATVVECHGAGCASDASGTVAMYGWAVELTSLDLDPQADLKLEITLDWSASNAGNSAVCTSLNVIEYAV